MFGDSPRPTSVASSMRCSALSKSVAHSIAHAHSHSAQNRCCGTGDRRAASTAAFMTSTASCVRPSVESG